MKDIKLSIYDSPYDRLMRDMPAGAGGVDFLSDIYIVMSSVPQLPVKGLKQNLFLNMLTDVGLKDSNYRVDVLEDFLVLRARLEACSNLKLIVLMGNRVIHELTMIEPPYNKLYQVPFQTRIGDRIVKVLLYPSYFFWCKHKNKRNY